MTDKNLAKELIQFVDWSGSRTELIDVIGGLEKVEPKARMLQSKKAPYDILPINNRRIQWFITKEMMPKPFGHKYSYVHLLYYWVSILARKRERLQFQQLAGLINNIPQDKALHYIDDISSSLSQLKFHNVFTPDFTESEVMEEDTVSKELISLGRKEGRVLESRHIRLAITPWCHLYISESEMNDMNDNKAQIISSSIYYKLKDFI